MKCPTCGHDPDDIQQKRAAVSRWSGMTKKERSEEMSRVRKKGIKKPKRALRRSNVDYYDARGNGFAALIRPETNGERNAIQIAKQLGTPRP